MRDAVAVLGTIARPRCKASLHRRRVLQARPPKNPSPKGQVTLQVPHSKEQKACAMTPVNN